MSYTTAMNNFVNSTGMSAGWKECEKENYFYPLNHSTSQGTMPMNFMPQQQPSMSLSSSYPPPQQQQRSVSPLPGSVPVIEEVELEELVTFLRKFDSKVAAIWGSNDNEQEEAKKRIMNDNNLLMLMMMNGSQSHTGIANSSNDGKGVIGERVWGQPLPSSTEVSLNGLSKSRLFEYQDNNNNKNIEKQELKMDDEDMLVEEDLLTSENTHFRPIQQEVEEDDSSLGFWSLEDPTDEYTTYKRTADNTFPLRFKIRNENDKAVQTDWNYNYSTSTSSFASTTSPWNAPISTSSMGFTSDEEDGVAAATDKLYLW